MSGDSSQRENLNQVIDEIEADVYGVVSLESLTEEIRARAVEMLPGAKSIIVMAQEIFPEVIRHLNSRVYLGELALRDAYGSHMDLVGGRLNWEAYRLVKQLHQVNKWDMQELLFMVNLVLLRKKCESSVKQV